MASKREVALSVASVAIPGKHTDELVYGSQKQFKETTSALLQKHLESKPSQILHPSTKNL